MNIVRYNPGLRNFSNRSFNTLLDRFFNDTFDAGFGSRDTHYLPAVDIVETDKTFELEFAVPGMKKGDFEINFDEGKLTISGERKFEKETKEVNYHTRETRYGKFSRSFYLPENVDDTKINANYENGILNVVIPKTEREDNRRTIKVG